MSPEVLLCSHKVYVEGGHFWQDRQLDGKGITSAVLTWGQVKPLSTALKVSWEICSQ